MPNAKNTKKPEVSDFVESVLAKTGSRSLWLLHREKILELVAKGFSARAIAEGMEEAGIQLGYRTILYYLNKESQDRDQSIANVPLKTPLEMVDTTTPNGSLSPAPQALSKTPLKPGLPSVEKVRLDRAETKKLKLK